MFWDLNNNNINKSFLKIPTSNFPMYTWPSKGNVLFDMRAATPGYAQCPRQSEVIDHGVDGSIILCTRLLTSMFVIYLHGLNRSYVIMTLWWT